MAKRLIITISKDGTEVKIEAEGFVGESCKDATQLLVEALGTLTEDTPKQELYHSWLPGEVENGLG
jgi:hypothetical protein